MLSASTLYHQPGQRGMPAHLLQPKLCLSTRRSAITRDTGDNSTLIPTKLGPQQSPLDMGPIPSAWSLLLPSRMYLHTGKIGIHAPLQHPTTFLSERKKLLWQETHPACLPGGQQWAETEVKPLPQYPHQLGPHKEPSRHGIYLPLSEPHSLCGLTFICYWGRSCPQTTKPACLSGDLP